MDMVVVTLQLFQPKGGYLMISRPEIQAFLGTYQEGAEKYSLGLTKFQELAKEARACYKIGQLVLVNTEILDKYLEVYHITDSDFYK